MGKWRSYRPVPFIGCCNSLTLVLSDWSGLALQVGGGGERRVNNPALYKTFVQESKILPRNCGVMDLRLENWKSTLYFGTWNVCILYQSGAALNLVKELERLKLGILAQWKFKIQQYFLGNVITVDKEVVALWYRII